jgi:hypothetical protein
MAVETVATGSFGTRVAGATVASGYDFPFGFPFGPLILTPIARFLYQHTNVNARLGGWFGFGLHSWWIKQTAQEVLAHTMPQTARIGRHLMMTAPGHAEANTGAPVFQRGNGSSDVLHEILKEVTNISRVFGHSKGALVIENAILSLPRETTERLQVVTFGCPIAEETPTAGYSQFLGVIDGLGLLNSWGNPPNTVVPTHHSTNTNILLSIPVSLLTRLAMTRRAPQPAAITYQPLLAGPATRPSRHRSRVPRQ